MSDYNGWTNYETWRVNLELIDGLDPRDMGWGEMGKADLKDALKEYVNEILDSSSSEGIALDYARAFISSVDWWQIARHMIEAYPNEEEIEEA
jgi:hypothetical protein